MEIQKKPRVMFLSVHMVWPCETRHMLEQLISSMAMARGNGRSQRCLKYTILTTIRSYKSVILFSVH